MHKYIVQLDSVHKSVFCTVVWELIRY